MGSFWIENWDAPLLDPDQWADRLLPDMPDYMATPVVDNRSEAVKAMAIELQRREAKGGHTAKECQETKKRTAYENALERWRGTQAGEGNRSFFRFGVELRAAGFDDTEIRQLLDQHHADSRSNSADRRKQIPGIIDSLRRDYRPTAGG